MMFAVWYPEYVKKAQETTDILKDLGIQEQLIGFCHGDYNQHNVIFSREGIAVVHFENFCISEASRDLANFIRKMMEKIALECGLGMGPSPRICPGQKTVAGGTEISVCVSCIPGKILEDRQPLL